jgi:hypothetical protein
LAKDFQDVCVPLLLEHFSMHWTYWRIEKISWKWGSKPLFFAHQIIRYQIYIYSIIIYSMIIMIITKIIMMTIIIVIIIITIISSNGLVASICVKCI